MRKNSQTICMFVYNYFENDSRVLREAATLASAGFTVHIIAVWKKGVKKFEKIDNNILVHRLELIPIYIQLIGQKNFDRIKKIIYGSAKPAAGKGTSLIFMPGQKKRLGFFKFFFSTFKKFLVLCCFYREVKKIFSYKGIKADIFHCHDLNTLYIGHWMAKKQSAKLVYDSHELYVHHNRPFIPPKWFLKFEERFEKKYIKQTDAVITVSQSIAGYLEKKYNIPLPHLIMNAPNRKTDFLQTDSLNTDYSLGRELNIGKGYKILLYSGGITFGRGLEKVIKSLAGSKKLFFVMMGYGADTYKNYLTEVAGKAGVEKRVAFFGPVPSSEVTAYAASADVGIAPIENVCLSYYYCAPNKVFEYIQAGLPVVASGFPDLKQIVKTNDIGLTCDIAKPEEITRAVDRVLKNHAFYMENIQCIKNRYCWEKEALNLEKLYCSLAEKR